MKYITITVILFFFKLSSYGANGCYSNATGRFYYVLIGANDYDGSIYATSSATATCNTFTGGSYTGGNCLISGTSNANYLNATTDLIYPCPIDDYIPYLIMLVSGISLVFIYKRNFFLTISGK